MRFAATTTYTRASNQAPPRANHRPPALTTTTRDRKHTQVVTNYGFAMPYLNVQWAKVASAADCRGGELMPLGRSGLYPVKRI